MKFSSEQQSKDAAKLITTIMLVSNTRTDRARLRDRADVIVYGIKAGVTQLDIRRFLEVDGRKVVSIYIHGDCDIQGAMDGCCLLLQLAQ